MPQIAMRCVNLCDQKTRLSRALRRRGKISDDLVHSGTVKGVWEGIDLGVRFGGRTDDILPSPVSGRNRAMALPGHLGAGLTPGVRELDSRNASLLAQE